MKQLKWYQLFLQSKYSNREKYRFLFHFFFQILFVLLFLFWQLFTNGTSLDPFFVFVNKINGDWIAYNETEKNFHYEYKETNSINLVRLTSVSLIFLSSNYVSWIVILKNVSPNEHELRIEKKYCNNKPKQTE